MYAGLVGAGSVTLGRGGDRTVVLGERKVNLARPHKDGWGCLCRVGARYGEGGEAAIWGLVARGHRRGTRRLADARWRGRYTLR